MLNSKLKFFAALERNLDRGIPKISLSSENMSVDMQKLASCESNDVEELFERTFPFEAQPQKKHENFFDSFSNFFEGTASSDDETKVRLV